MSWIRKNKREGTMKLIKNGERDITDRAEIKKRLLRTILCQKI